MYKIYDVSNWKKIAPYTYFLININTIRPKVTGHLQFQTIWKISGKIHQELHLNAKCAKKNSTSNTFLRRLFP